MKKVRFIHTADLHLDTPFKGLASWNIDLAAKLKDATFMSFRRIVDLCIKEKVDFLVISGDIFESDNNPLAAQLKFKAELERLSDNKMPVYFVCGNHDPLNSWPETIQLPDNVFRFGSEKVENFTYSKGGIPIADIFGISFKNKAITENLALKFKLIKNPSPFSIAVLHGTVGASGPHENYAPFKTSDVIKLGFDYWALGHIHKRQIIHEANPAIVYPGNPQGRDFGETGAKGCYLVEISEGNKLCMTFIPVQVIRFEQIEVDLTGEDKIDKLQDKILKAKSNIKDYDDNVCYILRVSVNGRTVLHSHLNKPGELVQLLEYYNEGQLNYDNFSWIDDIKLDTQNIIDIKQIETGNDFIAEILRTFNEYKIDLNELKKLIKNIDDELINPQAKKVLPELSEYEQKEILEKAKWILLDQLIRET
jgi:DNA repair exonuclease SbcCD nuclease subunit